jgi:signal transduction histidine kinase
VRTSSGGRRSSLLTRGEQLEFQDKNLDQALSLYSQVLKEAPDTQTEAEALIRIARIQRKSGRLSSALETFRTISTDFDRVRSGTGPPLGLAARLETGALARDLEENEEALDVLFSLFDEMLNGRWELTKGEFEFAVQRTKELIEAVLSQGTADIDLPSSQEKYNALESRERAERLRTERYQLFQDEAHRVLGQQSSESNEGPSRRKMRFSLEAGQETFLVSLIPPVSLEAGDLRTWGMILDAGQLRETLIVDGLRALEPDDNKGWTLKDRQGALLAASSPPPAGTLTVEAGFKEGFPDWTLQFYQSDLPLTEVLLTSRRGVYFAMFLLIAGILAFGLVLTLRSVTREVELSRMKSDFVSTVSHEFKSPLTSIRQVAEMLESGRVPSEERKQRYYEALLEQSERLSLLTDNVLSFARLEEGKREFNFGEVDTSAFLAEVLSPIRERVRHEGFEVELEVEEPLPPLTADRGALSQVVSNLVDNAVKYSGASRKVLVEAADRGGRFMLAVTDFGLGIPKKEQPKVFDRFFRGGEELSRTVKGSGLGLTLVKQIVEAHGGTVRLESEPGKGSRFTVSLPYRQDKGQKS